MMALDMTLVSHLGWTLVHFVWQGALLGCATAVVLALLRNGSPQQRYLVACIALAMCLAWPALELLRRLNGGVGAADAAILSALSANGNAARRATLFAPLQSHLLWIVCFWLACASALALRMAVGLAWISRARASCSNAHWQTRLDALARRAGVQRAVHLRVVDDLASPVTAGWWRPVVLLPAALVSGMPPELLEALLAHELGHVKRGDYLVNLAQHVVEIVLFYHPAVWWISRQVRIEREQIADDLAVSTLGQARPLALALSELERLQLSRHHLAIGANGGDLLARIKRLLRPEAATLGWKTGLPALGLAIACAAMVANAASVVPATPTSARFVSAVLDFNSCGKPSWPADALRDRITGTVTMAFAVNTDGRPTDSRPIRSSGHRSLDEAARAGLNACRFKPATIGGTPIASTVQVQYIWKLD